MYIYCFYIPKINKGKTRFDATANGQFWEVFDFNSVFIRIFFIDFLYSKKK